MVVAVAVSGSQDTVAVVHLVVAEKATVVVVVLSTLEAVVALQLLGTSRGPDTAAVVARLVAEKAVVGLVASKMEAVVCAAWALLLGTSCQVVAAWTGGHC